MTTRRTLQVPGAEIEAIRSLAEQFGTFEWPDGQETDDAPRIVLGSDALTLTASAFEAIAQLMHELASGRRVTLVPDGAEMTTQEAADMLNVSRPHLVKLLDEGAIPFHRVGTHRRVLAEDVLEHRRRRAENRQRTLGRVARLALEDEGEFS